MKPTKTNQRPAQHRNRKSGGQVAHNVDGDVHNELTLDAKTPIPFEYGGSFFVAFNGAKYIPFLNGYDSFATLLLEARILSLTQNACVSTKTNYIVGKGIVITNLQGDTPADERFTNFFKYMNNRRQNGNAILRKIVDGFLTFGNQVVEVVRLEIKGEKYLYVYPKNFLDCKLSWPDANDEVKSVVISKRFRRGEYRVADEDMVTIPLYKRGPGKKDQYWLKDGKVFRTAIYLKNEVAGYDYYGLPSSVSSLPYQKLEYDSVRFNLDNIENNMVVGGAIILSGSVSEPEANRLATKIMKQHTGAGKRGRVAVYASESGVQDAKYLNFDTHRDGSYVEIDNKAQSKIIFANEWDAALAGLDEKGSMGRGAGYLSEKYYQKLQTVIGPMQTMIMENYWEPIIEIADDWLGTNWGKSYKFAIQQAQIVNNTSELTTTVKGAELFLKIINAVASGAWDIKAAIKFVAARYGITEAEATEQLGTINVRTKPTQTPGANIAGGGDS